MWMWGEFYCIMPEYEYECLDCKLLSKYCDLITEYRFKVRLKEGSKKLYCGKKCLIKLRYSNLRYGRGKIRLLLQEDF